MALEELRPDLERTYAVIIQKRDQVLQDPELSTVRLLNADWLDQENQVVDKTGELVKPFTIGDQLLEKAIAVGQSEEKGTNSIVVESAKAVYYMMVGIVYKGISLRRLYRTIDQVAEDQALAVVPLDRLAKYAAVAVAEVAMAGLKSQGLVLRRSAEALIGLNRFWEANGIPPLEVGREI